MQRREELTRFLKTVRARLSPADVGLRVGERRRTKGMRREEVAALAGISVTWYTWFEQGRDVQLSAQTLDRLSQTLRLSPEEREFLFALAQHRPAPLSPGVDRALTPNVQALLAALSIPALVMTLDWMVIGWNKLTARIFRDYEKMPASERNLFKILMRGAEYQRDEQEYRQLARRLIARFKWDYSRVAGNGTFDAIIAEMEAESPIFREYWSEPVIVSHFEGVHTTDVEGVGPIAFQHSSYAIEQSPGQRLVMFVPVDEESAARLRRVVSMSESGE